MRLHRAILLTAIMVMVSHIVDSEPEPTPAPQAPTNKPTGVRMYNKCLSFWERRRTIAINNVKIYHSPSNCMHTVPKKTTQSTTTITTLTTTTPTQPTTATTTLGGNQIQTFRVCSITRYQHSKCTFYCAFFTQNIASNRNDRSANNRSR